MDVISIERTTLDDPSEVARFAKAVDGYGTVYRVEDVAWYRDRGGNRYFMCRPEASVIWQCTRVFVNGPELVFKSTRCYCSTHITLSVEAYAPCHFYLGTQGHLIAPY